MELYIIYGLPGVGKLTVARELMRLLPDYRLFHIHQLADMLESVFGFDGRGFIELRNRMWPMVIKRAVADGIPGLITTFVFEKSLPDDMVPNVRDHVIQAGGKVRFVHLTCEKTENDRRLKSPERTRFRKMTSVEEFNGILKSRHFTTPHELDDTLSLDTTHLTAAQAAQKIVSHWN
ncbi:MAG: AAA family ATPase [Dehalococcoidia bacterium]|nr:AAA family ATPase [Dehalococcoidia bacterium]